MTRARDLELAHDYCNRLRKVRFALREVPNSKDMVAISFSGGRVEVSASITKDAILNALAIEERMIINTLEIWGVTEFDEP